MRTNLLRPQRLLKVLVVTAVTMGLWLGLGAVTVYAASFTYPHYDVDINVNKDSAVDVTETLTYNFVGLFHGVDRQITLNNPSLTQYCISSGQTCGGFERLSLVGVYDGNDKLVDPSAYTVGDITDQDSGSSFFDIKWTVWPNGQVFDGSQNFVWKIKYRLYGSVGFIGAAGSVSPYLYWNALPDTRGGDVSATKITITFPTNVIADTADSILQVYTDFDLKYDAEVSANVLTLTAQDIGDTGNFTVSYKLPVGSVDQPTAMTYSGWLPFFGTSMKIDGVDLGDIGGRLNSFPVGQHTVEFSFPGYQTKQLQITAVPGQQVTLDSTLTPGALMGVGLIADLLLNLLGLGLIPAAAIAVYLHWRRRGRDVNMPATVIPLFHPPVDVHPYLLGAIKDEKVDREDITGSIIDLAYRGYIRIKEIESGKNYELTKLEGKPKDAGLNDFEQKLMDALFDGEDTQETKDMGDSFAPKYPGLQSSIYKEMVTRGYFTESPQTTRAKYFGCGLLILALGGVGIFLTAIVGTAILGVPGPLLLGIALAVLGIGLLLAAKYMPAKTASGSKVLAEVLGFRMYMYYAERYRVQGLSPEEFEKFLSYAVVFGIEKEWATKFKDIYKGQPDWYVGPGGVYDVFWYSSFTRSFATSMNSTVYQPLQHASAGGGGWSGGGGGFGGFSGGGGGGGGSGAF